MQLAARKIWFRIATSVVAIALGIFLALFTFLAWDYGRGDFAGGRINYVAVDTIKGLTLFTLIYLAATVFFWKRSLAARWLVIGIAIIGLMLYWMKLA